MAQASPEDGPTPAGCAWPIAGSVEALLQAETEAVLQARPGVFKHQTSSSRGGMRPGPGPETDPGPGKPDHVAVAAIYGVGRRLHVDVRINGQIARYRNGRRWPEHAPKGGAGIYALAAVQGECVRLRSGAVARVACLDSDATADARRR
ncbi:hypothetical protein [Bordetella sp. N]|uniref:hypothetical protein n=1 Tax=Bordetella sp. N TaxID=1746199 RepID=UPI0007099EF1|nr:hypothetical protein [Bordetella sp. N]ALM83755.1 hypothetical protein ASB57_12910 [Bordetella sp. N]